MRLYLSGVWPQATDQDAELCTIATARLLHIKRGYNKKRKIYTAGFFTENNC